MMHSLCLAIGLAIASVAAAPAALAQGFMPASEVVKILGGVWAMESSSSKAKLEKLCSEPAMVIRILKHETGALLYEAEHIGSEVAGIPKEDLFDRSRIWMVLPDRSGRPRAIGIQYEGETRLDARGKPVVWDLLMPDRDTFYWHRADCPAGSGTAPSRRCTKADLVG